MGGLQSCRASEDDVPKRQRVSSDCELKRDQSWHALAPKPVEAGDEVATALDVDIGEMKRIRAAAFEEPDPTQPSK